jgi:hypothetical protein
MLSVETIASRQGSVRPLPNFKKMIKFSNLQTNVNKGIHYTIIHHNYRKYIYINMYLSGLTHTSCKYLPFQTRQNEVTLYMNV